MALETIAGGLCLAGSLGTVALIAVPLVYVTVIPIGAYITGEMRGFGLKDGKSGLKLYHRLSRVPFRELCSDMKMNPQDFHKKYAYLYNDLFDFKGTTKSNF